MPNKPFNAIISAACSLFLITGGSFAQDAATSEPTSDEVIERSGVPSEAVAAVVNDTVITTFDVRQRMRLILISAGGQIPIEAMGQVQQQALKDLISEKLKLQEMAKFELAASPEDIARELSLIAAQSNQTSREMERSLEAQGISLSTVVQQLETSMLWPELVQGRFRDRVRVNDDEIENTLQRMREEATLEQFLVSEICIPVDDPAQAQQYYQGGLQLIEQMRRGVPFTVVAQQFSACTTAAVGGDLGWLRAGELAPELDVAIRDLEPGSVTNPIPSDGAFMILAVRDKRAATIAGEPTFKLAYAAAPESVGDTVARATFDKLATADACSGRALRLDLGENVGFTLLENVTLDSMQPQFSEWVEDLDRGETSPVIRSDGYFHAAYVCDKDEGLGLPSREALESRIFGRQLNRISQQYLRDIERKASVDIRLKKALTVGG